MTWLSAICSIRNTASAIRGGSANCSIAAEFPGHLGANVIRPAAGQNLWSVNPLRYPGAPLRPDAVGNPSAPAAEIAHGDEGDGIEVRTDSCLLVYPADGGECGRRGVEQPASVSDHPAGDFPSTNLVPAVTGMLLPSLKEPATPHQ